MCLVCFGFNVGFPFEYLNKNVECPKASIILRESYFLNKELLGEDREAMLYWHCDDLQLIDKWPLSP